MSNPVFKRWGVVYSHDGSPVDECLYVHKLQAQKKVATFNNPDKYRVEQIAVMSITNG